MRGVPVLVLAAAFAVACGGRSTERSGSGDDDDTVAGTANGGTSNGGTSSVGASSGAPSQGGWAGSSAGAGFAGDPILPPFPPTCAQPLDAFPPSCDAPAVLRTYCAKSGCHNTAFKVAGLDLTADSFLIARILDVPATLGSIMTCGATGTMCDPASCAYCAMCPAPGCAKLLDSTTPANSWILRKMEPFIPGTTTMQSIMTIGCGDPMPTFNTPGTQNYSAADKACLIEFFMTLAREGRPCSLGNQELPAPRPPPCN